MRRLLPLARSGRYCCCYHTDPEII